MPQSAVVLKCPNVYGGPTREEAQMFCPKCGAATLMSTSSVLVAAILSRQWLL